jgi:hypothetical protein
MIVHNSATLQQTLYVATAEMLDIWQENVLTALVELSGVIMTAVLAVLAVLLVLQLDVSEMPWIENTSLSCRNCLAARPEPVLNTESKLVLEATTTAAMAMTVAIPTLLHGVLLVRQHRGRVSERMTAALEVLHPHGQLAAKVLRLTLKVVTEIAQATEAKQILTQLRHGPSKVSSGLNQLIPTTQPICSILLLLLRAWLHITVQQQQHHHHLPEMLLHLL